MIFHRVHKAIEEVSPIFDPAIKHFILADSDEQNAHGPRSPGVGHIGLVWRRERVGYLSQQPAAPTSQGFGSSDDFFACYERCDSTAPVQCENHVRELRTFFTVVLEPNIHTFSVLSETLPDFLKSKLC